MPRVVCRALRRLLVQLSWDEDYLRALLRFSSLLCIHHNISRYRHPSFSLSDRASRQPNRIRSPLSRKTASRNSHHESRTKLATNYQSRKTSLSIEKQEHAARCPATSQPIIAQSPILETHTGNPATMARRKYSRSWLHKLSVFTKGP